jgi:hypothetical protein
MGGAIWNGSSNYETWVSNTALYTIGTLVISPLTLQAFQCVVASAFGTVDPSANTTNWVQVPLPVWRPPIPLPYTKSTATPFAVPTLVTVPTDLRITPFLDETMDHDPQVIVTGNDALPLTVLGLFYKYDIVSKP